MSLLVTRPSIPVPFPVRAERSTLCSFAMRRTRGDDLMRSSVADGSRSSSSVSAVGPATGAGPLTSFGSCFGVSLGASFAGGSCFAGCFASSAAALAEPSPMTATTVLICTVWPSFTRISCRTPAAGEGISVSILSVEISNRGSSLSTRSPFFLSHFVRVPSKILSPIWGMMTFVSAIVFPLIGVQFASHADDIRDFGKEEFLERRAVRHRSVGRSNAANWTIEVFESLFRNHSRQFPRKASNLRVLVKQNHLVCFLYRLQDSFVVERQKRPEIEHVKIDSFFFQFLCCFKRDIDHRSICDDGDISAVAADRSLADRYDKVIGREFFLYAAIQEFVLEINHGVGIADCGFDQSLRVICGRRTDHFQSRSVDEVHFRILRVERSTMDTAAAGPSYHDRNACAPTVTALRREIRDLVESAGN